MFTVYDPPSEGPVARLMDRIRLRLALFVDRHPRLHNLSRGVADGAVRSSLGFIYMGMDAERSAVRIVNVTKHLPSEGQALWHKLDHAFRTDTWRTAGEASFYIGLLAYHVVAVYMTGATAGWILGAIGHWTNPRFMGMLKRTLNVLNEVSAVFIVVLIPIGTLFGPSSDVLLHPDA